jgi:hypothetical protein
MSSNQSMSPKQRFLFGRIFPLPFLLVGIFIFGLGMRDVMRANDSKSWPTTVATVQKSVVKTDVDEEGGFSYSALVLFDFEVNGFGYSGDQVSFGDFGSGDSERVEEIVKRYPEGTEVIVYFHPDDPDLSILESGLTARAWAIPGFGFVFLIFGVLMALVLPRLFKPKADLFGDDV